MSLRKFLNDRIAPLSMSGTGDVGGGAPAAAAPAAGAPTVHTFSSDKPFHDQLPEKYRGDTNFADIKDFDGLLSRYVNANKLVGADKATLLQLPKDMADDKAMADIYTRLGRPEAADKYAIGKRADGKDYSDTDKAFQAKLLPALHEAGLTQRQLDKIRPAWDGMMDEVAGASTKAAQDYATQQQTTLKTKLGAAYDDSMADAQAAIAHFGEENPELMKDLNIVKDGKATGDSAALVLLFAKLGKQMREDGIIKTGGGTPSGAVTPDAARTQMKVLESNSDFVKVWRTKGATGKDPDGKTITHEEAVKRMSDLYAFAYPPQE